MNIVVAIDPGPEQSAALVWDGTTILDAVIGDNKDVTRYWWAYNPTALVIEQVECFGMPVGKTIFETVFWTGRFAQIWDNDATFHRIPRSEVKLHICGSKRAKDSNIRQAIIDRFGAPGTKKNKGLTYRLKKDLWQAFALAVTYWDKNNG